MDFEYLKKTVKTTPSFVLDEQAIVSNLKSLVELKKQSSCQVLYSIKALPLEKVLQLASNYLDGLSVSSLFEARLAKEVLGKRGSIHITTPGLRHNEFKELSTLCSHISFNSNSQFTRLQSESPSSASLGLRLNPKLSFANDSRFDPCRPHSKLGIDFASLPEIPSQIKGLHFHTVFSSTDYLPLETTVNLLEQYYSHYLPNLTWLNLGGGYLHPQINNKQPFIDLSKKLQKKYSLEVFIEPGKAIVNNAGAIISTVIDFFISDQKNIIVLDTSVNHNPEVFEYQKPPELFEADSQGSHPCIIVGSSCLAGDVFGEYSLKKIPQIGDRLVFFNVGAYSLIKANRFNGYNLPDVYWVDKKNTVSLIKHSTYQDYRQQW